MINDRKIWYMGHSTKYYLISYIAWDVYGRVHVLLAPASMKNGTSSFENIPQGCNTI